MEKSVKEYFKKFYNMEPYLYISEDEWQMIMNTSWEKEDVVEALAGFIRTKIPIKPSKSPAACK